MTVFLGCQLGQRPMFWKPALCPSSGSMANLVEDKTAHLIVSLG
jgi:hypothetical protein